MTKETGGKRAGGDKGGGGGTERMIVGRVCSRSLEGPSWPCADDVLGRLELSCSSHAELCGPRILAHLYFTKLVRLAISHTRRALRLGDVPAAPDAPPLHRLQARPPHLHPRHQGRSPPHITAHSLFCNRFCRTDRLLRLIHTVLASRLGRRAHAHTLRRVGRGSPCTRLHSGLARRRARKYPGCMYCVGGTSTKKEPLPIILETSPHPPCVGS